MAKLVKLKFQKISPEAKSPEKANPTDSGYDLYSLRRVKIDGHTKKIINTGIRFEIPVGYHLEIKERSSIGSKTPLRVAAGQIDQDYRGETMVVLENTSPYPYTVEPGIKVAQAVLYHNIQSEIEEVASVDTNTERSEGGFGSSDKPS